MGKNIDLMNMPSADVREIIKNMPNHMAFLEQAEELVRANPGKTLVLFRGDMWRFKAVNDDYGYDAGDRAIAAFYSAITAAIDKLEPKGVAGRVEGDEFIGAFLAEKAEAEVIIKEIVAEYADSEIEGVPKTALGCRFGCVAGKFSVGELRIKEQLTVDMVEEARRLGKDSVYIQNV